MSEGTTINAIVKKLLGKLECEEFGPLATTFSVDYNLRSSTFSLYWIIDGGICVFDMSHIRPGLCLVFEKGTFKCTFYNEAPFWNSSIIKVGEYVIEDAKYPDYDETGEVITFYDKKGRIDRKDGKPALITKYTVSTYRRGKLHSYGPISPSFIKYDREHKIVKEKFHYKGQLEYGRKGNVHKFYDSEDTVHLQINGDRAEIKSKSYQIQYDEKGTLLTNVSDRPLDLQMSKYIDRYITPNKAFDYFAMKGLFYGTTDDPNVPYPRRQRCYFVHLNQEVDKPERSIEGKIIGYTKTTLAKNIRTTEQLLFKGQPIWQPLLYKVSDFKAILFTSEVRTFSLDEPSLANIWYMDQQSIPGNKHTKIPEFDTFCANWCPRWEGTLIKRKPEGPSEFPVRIEGFERRTFKEGPSPNIHMGQRKLLNSEIEFLTKVYADIKDKTKPILVFYAGAAPGIHTPLLRDMFPMTVFVLFDPRKFDIKPSKRMAIVNDLFHGDEFDIFGEKVYLISDIRVDPKDEQVGLDNELQKGWAMHPLALRSIMKHRLPFKGRSTISPKGEIYTQAWAPPLSAEARIITDPKHILAEYNNLEHEDKMFYFNTVVRRLPFTKVDEVFGVNYDVMREAGILKNYIRMCSKTSSSESELNHKVASWMNKFDEFFSKLEKHKPVIPFVKDVSEKIPSSLVREVEPTIRPPEGGTISSSKSSELTTAGKKPRMLERKPGPEFFAKKKIGVYLGKNQDKYYEFDVEIREDDSRYINYSQKTNKEYVVNKVETIRQNGVLAGLFFGINVPREYFLKEKLRQAHVSPERYYIEFPPYYEDYYFVIRDNEGRVMKRAKLSERNKELLKDVLLYDEIPS